MKSAVISGKWQVAGAKRILWKLAGELACRRAGAAVGAGALFLLSLNGCARKTADAQNSSTSFSAAESNADTARLFSVPQDQMQHVSVVTVERTRLPRALRLSGSVAYNSFETTPVITQAGGPVSRILAAPGQFVRAGQPLLYVSSPDYAQTRTAYLKARDALALAEKNYSRAKDLYDHHAIAQAELQQSESASNQAQADLQAAEQSVRVLGIPNPETLLSGQASAEIPVLAPISGEIVERLVGPGQVIQAGGTQCFTITNLGTVWVLANVYEKDLGYIHDGDAVAIQTDAYPETFKGRISYVASALDPASRTLQVRIVTNNPGGKLKKDMYVTAVIQAGAVNDAITVPDAAVLRNDENEPFVYVATGQNQFGQRLVTIGDSQDGRTQVLTGLQAGDKVVADGSLFLQFANSFQK